MRAAEIMLPGLLIVGAVAQMASDNMVLPMGQRPTHSVSSLADACAAPNPALHPHEPPGYGEISRLDFVRLPTDEGWWPLPRMGLSGLANDPAAPTSPPWVMTFSAASASPLGELGALGAFGDLSDGAFPTFAVERRLEASVGGVYLDLQTRSEGTLNTVALILSFADGASDTFILGQVRAGLSLRSANQFAWLPPDVEPSWLTSGVWHRWELVVEPGGDRVEWWVDGTAHGSATDIAMGDGAIVRLGLEVRRDPYLGGWTGIGIEQPNGTVVDDVYLSGDVCANDHIRLQGNRVVDDFFADAVQLRRLLPEVSPQLLDPTGVTVPVFNGLGREAQIDERRAEARRLEAAHEELRRVIRSEVETALADLLALSARLDAAREQDRLAEEEVRQAQSRLVNGVTGNADVVNALLARTRARTSLTEALTDRAAGQVTLRAVQGRLMGEA